MDVKCKELANVHQYVCPQGASTEPPVRETVAQLKGTQHPQRVRAVVHVLSRTSFTRERPSVEQQSVPSYSGFQSCLLPYTPKSKAYYHVT